MKYKSVGQLPGLELSVVGLGCWGLSGAGLWTGSSDEQSTRTVQAAREGGVNLFDVAPVYGFGHAEEILGRALAGHRDEVIIATKCGLVWDEQGNIRNDLSPASIAREVDASLRRLGTDHIDVYQLHWPDPATPIEDTMEYLLERRTEGVIRHIGVSNFSIELTERARACGPVVSHQGLYNMLEQNAASYHEIPLEYRTLDEVLPYVEAHGMAFFPYSPLLQGLLTDDLARSGNFGPTDVRRANPHLSGPEADWYFAAARRLQTIAREAGKPLAQIAINWLIEQPAVTSVISGGTQERQVRENVAATDWELTPDLSTAIHEALAQPAPG